MHELERTAAKIAEQAIEKWRNSTAYRSNVGVPLGVIAGLTLMDHWSEQDSAKLVGEWSDDQIADALLTTWSMFTIIRPELAFRLSLFGDWLNDDPRDAHTLEAAADVARAAGKAGLFEITSDPEKLRSFDLLGVMHQTLSSQRDKQARGEFYTPGNVGNMMGQMMISTDPKPGQSICDPCSGTGGLLRSAAQALREKGGDPHSCSWWACDIDPLAIAAVAVNFELWDLGPNVVVGCANTLAEGDWHVRAIQEQVAAIEAQENRMRIAKLLTLTSDLGEQADSDAEDEAAA